MFFWGGSQIKLRKKILLYKLTIGNNFIYDGRC